MNQILKGDVQRYCNSISIFILMLLSSVSVYGYEIAPRISDREIVESLAEIKQGQIHLSQRIDAVNQRIDDQIHSVDKRFEGIDKRFEAIDKRFEAIDKRFESLEKRIDSMAASMEKRFDDIDQRFESMQELILTLFGSTMAVVMAMLGYMIWDRRSAQKPMYEKFRHLEHHIVGVDEHISEIDEHLEMRNPSGPVLARMMAALRKLAETNPDVASVLRSFSLL
ncbi:hypothetical protein [Desulfamplus magnetovallimortis]|nr:hypothetical protein [Desulfamplus magnetovallimortis]